MSLNHQHYSRPPHMSTQHGNNNAPATVTTPTTPTTSSSTPAQPQDATTTTATTTATTTTKQQQLEFERVVDVHVPQAVAVTVAVWVGLVVVAFLVDTSCPPPAPTTTITTTTTPPPSSSSSPSSPPPRGPFFLAILLLTFGLVSYLILPCSPWLRAGQVPQRVTGLLLAAMATLVLSIATNLMLVFFDDGTNALMLVRWCEWIPLSGLFVFVAEAMDASSSSSSTSSSHSCCCAGWPPAVRQMLATACAAGAFWGGGYSTTTTNNNPQLSWSILGQVLSWTLGYWPLHLRLQQQKQALLGMAIELLPHKKKHDPTRRRIRILADRTTGAATGRKSRKNHTKATTLGATTIPRPTTAGRSPTATTRTSWTVSWEQQQQQAYDRRLLAHQLLRQVAILWTSLFGLYYGHAFVSHLICYWVNDHWRGTTSHDNTTTTTRILQDLVSFLASSWRTNSSSNHNHHHSQLLLLLIWLEPMLQVVAKGWLVKTLLQGHYYHQMLLDQDRQEQTFHLYELRRLLQLVWDSTTDTIVISVQGPQFTSTFVSPSFLFWMMQQQQQQSQPQPQQLQQQPQTDNMNEKHATTEASSSSSSSSPQWLWDGNNAGTMGLVLKTANNGSPRFGPHEDNHTSTTLPTTSSSLSSSFSSSSSSSSNFVSPLQVLEARYIKSTHLLSGSMTGNAADAADLEQHLTSVVAPLVLLDKNSLSVQMAAELVQACWAGLQERQSQQQQQQQQQQGSNKTSEEEEEEDLDDDDDEEDDSDADDPEHDGGSDFNNKPRPYSTSSSSNNKKKKKKKREDKKNISFLLVHEFNHSTKRCPTNAATTVNNNNNEAKRNDGPNHEDPNDCSSGTSTGEDHGSTFQNTTTPPLPQQHKDSNTTDAGPSRHRSSSSLCLCELKVSQKSPDSLVAIVRDMTERDRRFAAEQAHAQAVARQKDAQTANRFVRHEIKNRLLSGIELCHGLQQSLKHVVGELHYGTQPQAAEAAAASNSRNEPNVVVATSFSASLNNRKDSDDTALTALLQQQQQQQQQQRKQQDRIEQLIMHPSLTKMAGLIGQVDRVLHEILDTVMADALARDVMHDCYEPSPKPTDLVALLKSSCSRIGEPRFPLYLYTSYTGGGGGGTTHTTTTTAFPKLLLDGSLLRFIHRNAISNAIKYGKQQLGGMIATIVHYDDDSQRLTIKVMNEPGRGHEKLMQNASTESSQSVFTAGKHLHNAVFNLSDQQHSWDLLSSVPCSNQGGGEDSLSNSYYGSCRLSSGDDAWIMQKCAKHMGGTCSISFESNETVFEFCCPAPPVLDHTTAHTTPLDPKSTTIPSSIQNPHKTEFFCLPPNTWAVGIDDSWIQRKVLLRMFANIGIDGTRRQVIGKSLKEVESTAQVLANLLEQDPSAKCLVLVDENLDYAVTEDHDDDDDHVNNNTNDGTAPYGTASALVGISRIIRSGSQMMESMLQKMPLVLHRNRIVCLVRSANDSSQDISLYQSRTDGFFPKMTTQREDVLEMLQPIWIQRFGEGRGAAEDTRITTQLVLY
ncbi:hypothetical protein ACA910_003584 [Epithemia clementina (nom. ined.)]